MAEKLDKEETRVIFRTLTQEPQKGEVVALFPEIPAGDRGGLCQSYMHVGQHGGANYHAVVEMSRPATAAEYAELAAELKSRGYRLRPAMKAQWRTHDARRMAARAAE